MKDSHRVYLSWKTVSSVFKYFLYVLIAYNILDYFDILIFYSGYLWVMTNVNVWIYNSTSKYWLSYGQGRFEDSGASFDIEEFKSGLLRFAGTSMVFKLGLDYTVQFG